MDAWIPVTPSSVTSNCNWKLSERGIFTFESTSATETYKHYRNFPFAVRIGIPPLPNLGKLSFISDPRVVITPSEVTIPAGAEHVFVVLYFQKSNAHGRVNAPYHVNLNIATHSINLSLLSQRSSASHKVTMEQVISLIETVYNVGKNAFPKITVDLQPSLLPKDNILIQLQISVQSPQPTTQYLPTHIFNTTINGNNFKKRKPNTGPEIAFSSPSLPLPTDPYTPPQYPSPYPDSTFAYSEIDNALPLIPPDPTFDNSTAHYPPSTAPFLASLSSSFDSIYSDHSPLSPLSPPLPTPLAPLSPPTDPNPIPPFSSAPPSSSLSSPPAHIQTSPATPSPPTLRDQFEKFIQFQQMQFQQFTSFVNQTQIQPPNQTTQNQPTQNQNSTNLSNIPQNSPNLSNIPQNSTNSSNIPQNSQIPPPSQFPPNDPNLNQFSNQTTHTTQSQTTKGQTTRSQTTKNQTTKYQTTKSQTPQNQTTQNQTTQNQTTSMFSSASQYQYEDEQGQTTQNQFTSDLQPAIKRVVLLFGITGNGKSTCANTIIGKSGFFISSASSVSTQHIQVIEEQVDDIWMQVIDTVGIGDSRKNDYDISTEFLDGTLTKYLTQGINRVFFMVGTRFTAADAEAFRLLTNVIFTPEIAKVVTIVRTRFPEYYLPEACNKDIQQLKSVTRLPIIDMLTKCSYRVLHVDFKPPDDNKVLIREMLLSILRESHEVYTVPPPQGILNRISKYFNLETRFDELRTRINSRTAIDDVVDKIKQLL